jgi:hypothetical protein
VLPDAAEAAAAFVEFADEAAMPARLSGALTRVMVAVIPVCPCIVETCIVIGTPAGGIWPEGTRITGHCPGSVPGVKGALVRPGSEVLDKRDIERSRDARTLFRMLASKEGKASSLAPFAWAPRGPRPDMLFAAARVEAHARARATGHQSGATCTLLSLV